MKIKELQSKIEQLKKENPDLNLDEMEIGPLFSSNAVMMTADLILLENGAWENHPINQEKCIGLIWHC